MSREVVGLAPDDAVELKTPAPSGPTVLSRLSAPDTAAVRNAPIGPDGPDGPDRPTGTNGSTGPGAPRGSRRGTVAGLTLAVVVVAATFGWTGTGSMTSSRQRDDVVRGAALVATVRDMSGRPDGLGSAAVVTRVRVVNVGTVPVTVTGAERGFLAARVEQVGRTPVDLVPGAGVDLQLMVRVECSSPNQLALPALSMRRPDGVLRPVPIDGATAELVRVCDLGGAASRTLQLRDAHVDGDRLAVVMFVPSGRTVRIMAVTAGDVALTGRPLPTSIDGQSRTMWLDAPTQCAVSWRTQGMPRTLSLTVDGTIDGVGRSHVVLDAGYALAAWLLQTACKGTTT